MNWTSRIVSVVLSVLILIFPFRGSEAHAAPDNARVTHPKTIVVGDSLAVGAGAKDPARQAWPTRIGAKNMAAGGTCLIATGCGTAVTLTDSFDEVLRLTPRRVLVSVGRNDLCHAPTEDLIAGYEALRIRAIKAGAVIQFTTITPAGKAWQWPCEDQRIEVNEWLRTLPGTLDFEAVTMTPHGMLRSKFDSGDGLHLNGRGYALLARVVRSRL